MLQAIQKTTSLARISKRKLSGQIATILILMIVAVLIFVLVIINLGKVSLTTTTLANAADSAALTLGSQLATKANSLWHSLDNQTEKCKKSGWFKIILAIVCAVVAIIIVILSWGSAYPAYWGLWLVAVGLVAGGIGGAIGAAIDGTNVLTGALQGAITGAAIGASAAIGVELGIAYVGL
ncbi:MAG: pilus assembly protein TadG-related protein, partial [Candidatus Omnitrophota bacterium]|nr:pilus assembly protein TadG-related protein [Candidatus Omnitrophota bacterium]